MADIQFTSEVRGLPFVVAKLKAVRAGIAGFLGKRRIEKYLVEKTKARFEPRGTNPVAQRDPTGRMWPFAASSTVRSRKSRANRSRSRALYDTGLLQRSVVITKKGPGLNVIQTTGGSFRVGIKANTKAAKYGLFQQLGGVTPRGGVVPPRPFLGVGKAEAEELAILGKDLIEANL
jgi:hypothetical protein